MLGGIHRNDEIVEHDLVYFFLTGRHFGREGALLVRREQLWVLGHIVQRVAFHNSPVGHTVLWIIHFHHGTSRANARQLCIGHAIDVGIQSQQVDVGAFAHE